MHNVVYKHCTVNVHCARVLQVVRNVLRETDLNNNKFITSLEFRHIVTKSPDFANSFRIRL